ncbi:MAG: type II toxin-antitoxin system HicA family toxin [Gammaproteobacteria bacterium]
MNQGHRKLLERIVEGRSDSAIRFSDLLTLLDALGFEQRGRGSHRIFSKDGLREIVTLQPRGNLAKPYQVRQVRKLILRYRLGLGDE